MCLLDRVERYDENGIRCTAQIRETNPLRRYGCTSSIIGLEYGAQATGLWAALRQNVQAKPFAGYILATRNFKLLQPWLPDGKKITIDVEKKLLGGDSAICLFKLSHSGRILAEGQLTLMMKPLS